AVPHSCSFVSAATTASIPDVTSSLATMPIRSSLLLKPRESSARRCPSNPPIGPGGHRIEVFSPDAPRAFDRHPPDPSPAPPSSSATLVRRQTAPRSGRSPIVSAQEARIAAFERLVAKLGLEKGFLKKPGDAVRILMPSSGGLAFALPNAFGLGHMQQVNFAA